jgi:hypothetical protein
MVVRIAGQHMSLWRAVDDEGEVLDMLVQQRRNTTAVTGNLSVATYIFRRPTAGMSDSRRSSDPEEASPPNILPVISTGFTSPVSGIRRHAHASTRPWDADAYKTRTELNLMRRSPAKDSMRLKRKVAAWNDDFLISLIAQ